MQPETITAPAGGGHQLDAPDEPADPLPQWPLLSGVRGPADLRSLPPEELPRLAAEIRQFLVEAVSRTGGHLGPSLGVVELTIALHRAFDSPRDRILWDTGHQAYVHKLLTGRHDFSRLRADGGLSGYPSRAESEHDIVENSHASTALGYADGLAKAHQLLGQHDRRVVAVVGDGALTGGMAWEALNNIGAAPARPLIIVVNDNGRSYASTIGGLANHLAANGVPPSTTTTPNGGTWRHTNFFTTLGFTYLGPVDGHDTAAVEAALAKARDFAGPVVVHCITRKGHGYPPAERDQADHLHAVGIVDPQTGRPATPAAKASWTSVFGEEMVAIGHERPDVVAITAAMLEPVGLGPFARAYPDRIFDVGIAEQHAVGSAAGLATAGLHPVVAVYATFLNRAFDQVLMDVALHRCGVTFVLDRAGITGTDGPSHNGMWDLSVLQVVPGLRIAAPRDTGQLRAQLREALEVGDAPTVVRFPKADAEPAIPAVGRVGGADVLFRSAVPGRAGADPVDVLLVAIGTVARPCLDAADLLARQGFSATVADPRWVKPVDPGLVRLAAVHRLVVTVEDNGCAGGAGATFAQALSQANIDTPVRHLGIPQEFQPHAARSDLIAAIGLDGPGIAARAASFARMVVTDWPSRKRPAVRLS